MNMNNKEGCVGILMWVGIITLILAVSFVCEQAQAYYPEYEADKAEAEILLKQMYPAGFRHAVDVGIDPHPWVEEMLEANPKMKGVRPELQILMSMYWIRWGKRIKIVYGLRTAEEQKKLFKKGRSKLDGVVKKSQHQTGNAIDFAPCYTPRCKKLMWGNNAGENWQIERESSRVVTYYEVIQGLMFFQYEFHKLCVTSGGDFRHTGLACAQIFKEQKGCFRDSGHVELRTDRCGPNPFRELLAGVFR